MSMVFEVQIKMPTMLPHFMAIRDSEAADPLLAKLSLYGVVLVISLTLHPEEMR